MTANILRNNLHILGLSMITSLTLSLFDMTCFIKAFNNLEEHDYPGPWFFSTILNIIKSISAKTFTFWPITLFRLDVGLELMYLSIHIPYQPSYYGGTINNHRIINIDCTQGCPATMGPTLGRTQ